MKTKIHTDATAFDKALLFWTAPEHPHVEKGKLTWLLHGLGAGGLFTYGVLSGAWSFSLALAAAAATYFYFHKKHKPSRANVTISPMGIKIGERKYPYTHIKAFWMHYNPPFLKTLNFRPSDRLKHDVTISMEDQDPSLVRHILSQHLPEWEGKEESLTELVVRALRL